MSTAKVHQSLFELSRLSSKDLYVTPTIIVDVAEYLGLVLKNTNPNGDDFIKRKQLAFGYWLALASLHERLIPERSNLGLFATVAKDGDPVLHGITNFRQNKSTEDRILKILSTTSKSIFDKPVRIESNRIYNQSKIEEALGDHNTYFNLVMPGYRTTIPSEWIALLKFEIKSPEFEAPDFTAGCSF